MLFVPSIAQSPIQRSGGKQHIKNAIPQKVTDARRFKRAASPRRRDWNPRGNQMAIQTKQAAPIASTAKRNRIPPPIPTLFSAAELVFITTESAENTLRPKEFNSFLDLELKSFFSRELNQQFLRGGFWTAAVRQYIATRSQSSIGAGPVEVPTLIKSHTTSVKMTQAIETSLNRLL